jgi:hypothetical protein
MVAALQAQNSLWGYDPIIETAHCHHALKGTDHPLVGWEVHVIVEFSFRLALALLG